MSAIGPASPAAQAAALLLQSDPAAGQSLTLGQVLQAKVLRQLDAGRYLVRLGGHERVVESASPLRPDDILSLRVAGSRERVELERVDREAGARAGAVEDAGEQSLLSLGGGRAAAIIEELFRRYRGTLDAPESERLKRAVGRAARPERMALAGLVLSKAGLPVQPELLEPLYETLGARSGALAPLPEVADAPAGGASGAPRWWPIGQCVLNVQGGGAIAHRVGMVPLEAGERSIEVELALFEERDDAGTPGRPGAAPIRHRKAVLALDLEHLGRVELRAAMADDHIRVALATHSGESTNALLRHAEPLSRALAEAGWQVDEISHETRAASSPNAVVGAAVEHLITPGSVSRLV